MKVLQGLRFFSKGLTIGLVEWTVTYFPADAYERLLVYRLAGSCRSPAITTCGKVLLKPNLVRRSFVECRSQIPLIEPHA